MEVSVTRADIERCLKDLLEEEDLCRAIGSTKRLCLLEAIKLVKASNYTISAASSLEARASEESDWIALVCHPASHSF
jgi:hypothetical protein